MSDNPQNIVRMEGTEPAAPAEPSEAERLQAANRDLLDQIHKLQLAFAAEREKEARYIRRIVELEQQLSKERP